MTRAVRLPSSVTCLCTKSRLLPNDERFDPNFVFFFTNNHRPRHVFRYNTIKRVQTQQASIKTYLINRSDVFYFFISTLLEMTTGAPHVR